MNFDNLATLLVALAFSVLVTFANPLLAQSRCTNDTDCAKGEICTNGGNCVVGCRSTGDCRTGLYCVNNQCTTTICQPGAERSCYSGPSNLVGVGQCTSGVQLCNASGDGWTQCFGEKLPTREEPDRIDNDCNGRIDDGISNQCNPGSKRLCYGGPSQTVDVGVCKAGIQYCEQDNTWADCIGQVLPSAEQADGKDNDCNGKVDDSPRVSGGPASSGSNVGASSASTPGELTVMVPWRTENIANPPGAILECILLDDQCLRIDAKQLKLQGKLNVNNLVQDNLNFNGPGVGSTAVVTCSLTSASDSSLSARTVKAMPGSTTVCP